MTPEERQRLKEKELAHLRELKRLKRLARHAKREKKLNQALSNITGALDQVTGSNDDALNQLEFENARSQARLDLALEAQSRAEISDPPMQEPVVIRQCEPKPPAKTIGSILRRTTKEPE